MNSGIFSILFLLVIGITTAEDIRSSSIKRSPNPNQLIWHPKKVPFQSVPFQNAIPAPGLVSGHRFRREAASKKKNKFTFNANNAGGKTSWDAEVRRNIWQNKQGKIWVSGGANKQPGYKTEARVGIGGSIKF